MAAHYGDARDDFIVTDNVELPWPSARGGMEWEWRVVSLKDMFPGRFWPFVCERRMWVQKKTSGGGGMRRPPPSPGQTAVDEMTGGSKVMASLLGGGGGGVALREVERVPTEAGTRGSRMSLWPSRPCKGDRDPSVLADAGREKTSSTLMLSPPPPHR